MEKKQGEKDKQKNTYILQVQINVCEKMDQQPYEYIIHLMYTVIIRQIATYGNLVW